MHITEFKSLKKELEEQAELLNISYIQKQDALNRSLAAKSEADRTMAALQSALDNATEEERASLLHSSPVVTAGGQ